MASASAMSFRSRSAPFSLATRASRFSAARSSLLNRKWYGVRVGARGRVFILGTRQTVRSSRHMVKCIRLDVRRASGHARLR